MENESGFKEIKQDIGSSKPKPAMRML
jgi:hypothetical protein